MGIAQRIEIADAAKSTARFESRRLDRPHPDIELGVARSSLAYLVCAPDQGINTDTGVVLFFVGYGMEPCGRYVRSLLSYIANKHNCIAASVDYFGANLSGSTKCNLVPHPEFFANLKKHHGIEVNAPKGFDVKQLHAQLGAALKKRGIMQLHPACVFLGVSTEYHSMGFLPALDGLQVAFHLVTDFSLNKRRLFVFGTSYGGYIANLVGKFAPQSFRMVIDNSGFSSAQDDIWNIYGMTKFHSREGVETRLRMVAAFSQESSAANYFAPARKEIRNLLNPSHVFDNSARLYGYHSATDNIAPTEAKLRLRNVFAGKAPYELEIIDESKVDGRVFKDLSHGMHASLRGVFDLSYDKFMRHGGPLADHTDFDLQSSYLFPCGREDYVVSYSSATGVKAELRKAMP